MPVLYLRGPYKGPSLEQLEGELARHVKHLTQIDRTLFQQVKGATEARTIEPNNNLQKVRRGDWVYIRAFKCRWNDVSRTGAHHVILATPTAVKVIGKNRCYHLNHCTWA